MKADARTRAHAQVLIVAAEDKNFTTDSEQ